MALSLTFSNLLQTKIPGKNRIRKKSGHKIHAIFEQILRTECLKYGFMAKHRNFLLIFTNFDIFQLEIFQPILKNPLKTSRIYISHEILTYITQ